MLVLSTCTLQYRATLNLVCCQPHLTHGESIPALYGKCVQGLCIFGAHEGFGDLADWVTMEPPWSPLEENGCKAQCIRIHIYIYM